jgi:type IV secretory pathway VirB2 component (pilin)
MNRLFKKGLITTIIGLGFIVFAGALLWTGKSTYTEIAGWITTGLLFLRAKDSLIKIDKNEDI